MKRSVRSTPRVVLLLTLLCGGPLIPSPTLGQAAGDERQERLQERDRLWAEAQRLRAGPTDEAITAAEKMLAIEREVLGASARRWPPRWSGWPGVHRARDFAAARKARQEVLPSGEAAWENHGR